MEYNVEVPIYVQVVRDIKKRIVRKQLLPGEKLPSNRELAVLYKVNPNTAARIYKEMEAGTWNIHYGGRTDAGRITKGNGRSTVEGLFERDEGSRIWQRRNHIPD